MEEGRSIKKYVLIVLFAGIVLGVIFSYQYARFFDGKLRVVFCNVGQGDAIVIKTPQGIDMLVDGGPDQAVLDCLNRHMPFWDRTIEVVFLTHPHADHLDGLIDVVKRYTVKQFVTEEVINNTASYRELVKKIQDSSLSIQFASQGDVFTLSDGVKIKVLGPSKAFLKRTSPYGTIGEKEEFASLVLLVSYGSVDFLFTGDSQVSGLEDALRGSTPKIDILQAPHHGSKTGLNTSVVSKINPSLVVFSVGKNNYGHPAPQILKILSERDTKILRTDEQGTVEIVSDGKGFGIR